MVTKEVAEDSHEHFHQFSSSWIILHLSLIKLDEDIKQERETLVENHGLSQIERGLLPLFNDLGFITLVSWTALWHQQFLDSHHEIDSLGPIIRLRPTSKDLEPSVWLLRST